MALVDVDAGVRLYAQDLGDGPPIVLVAGFGLDHRVWDRQVRVLAAHHRVVCVDQRGHGLSDKPWGGYDFDRMARDLLAVADKLELNSATLVGWSLGGQTAFKATALDDQHRFAQLVLVGSNGVRASRSDRFPFGAPPEALEESLLREEFSDRLKARRSSIATGFAAHAPDALVDWLVSLSMQMPSWAAAALYHAMLNTDLIDDIDAIDIPVLQIIGEQDPVHSARGAHWLCGRLAESTLVELPGCGHFPMFEAPDEFDCALNNFIDAAGRT